MGPHFLGIDLGSSYTKFVVVDSAGEIVHYAVIPTLSRRREAFENETRAVHDRFDISRTCATGYGRQSVEADLRKTELVCAAAGVSVRHPVRKCILDIGGEDIKIIEADAQGGVVDFFMNDRCSAGTGTFITEIAERAELEVSEMCELAKKSKSGRIINSFCTVFAKSEILGWKFNGTPIEDIARGIYLSVVDRICKLPIKRDLPVFLCGGVIAYHRCLADMLRDALQSEIQVVAQPQFAVALGAAILARDSVVRDRAQPEK